MPKGPGFVPCTACGGTGAVTVIEIDKQGRVTHVRKICGQCGGKGGYHV